MNRIANAFQNGKALVAFITAGDPSADKTVEFALEMAKAGADLIELGIPFSDPVAEGPVIQNASVRALNAGTTTDTVFSIARRIREQSQVPLVFLTYLNTVHRYGYDAFFKACRECGVDGVIIPDLPYEEKGEVAAACGAYRVALIPLVAPTSGERIHTIAAEAEGFVYLVSSMGVTGVRESIRTDVKSMVAAVRAATRTPVAVGFGISTPAQAGEMAALGDGAIVGSAIVRLIAQHGGSAAPHIAAYVREMKQAVQAGG